MSVSIVCFPGSNCDQDARKAVKSVWGQEPDMIWHQDRLPVSTKLAVLPGGFSYGDYLRAGAIARFSPVMKSVLDFAAAGGAVLGICNGFQILLESDLLPGAMLRNKSLHFRCEWRHLRVERQDTLFSRGLAQVIRIPIAHGEGNWFAPDDVLGQLESRGQILFRYSNELGEIVEASNPNGSRANVAGLLNESGNVLGMMPHPERAMDPDLGGEDGRAIWMSLIQQLGLRT